MRDMDDKVYEQAVNVATLPGIVQASYAMPDAHWGYGFPIGGVAAFDPDAGGVVSAGGVGFDISCGVRCLHTGLHARRTSWPCRRRARRRAVHAASRPASAAPARSTSTRREMDAMLTGGARWAVERGYGTRGRSRAHRGARPDAACQARQGVRARQEAPARRDGHARLRQPLPRGAGGRRTVYDAPIAAGLRLARGRHRGEDPLRLARPRPPDRHRVPEAAWRSTRRALRHPAARPRAGLRADQLASVGQDYLGAMRAAINCALANRQILTHLVREVFADVLPQARLPLLYDVSHNTCKVEEHVVDGRCASCTCTARARRARSGPAIPTCRRAARRRPAGADRRHDGHRLVRAGRHAPSPKRWRSARPATAPAAHEPAPGAADLAGPRSWSTSSPRAAS